VAIAQNFRQQAADWFPSTGSASVGCRRRGFPHRQKIQNGTGHRLTQTAVAWKNPPRSKRGWPVGHIPSLKAQLSTDAALSMSRQRLERLFLLYGFEVQKLLPSPPQLRAAFAHAINRLSKIRRSVSVVHFLFLLAIFLCVLLFHCKPVERRNLRVGDSITSK
jgi:hypothetical protein